MGIPAVADKLLQLAVAKILEAIYEQDFLPTSYGYRPKVGAKKAVQDLTYELQFGRNGSVVEADIKGYFDTIDHDWLLRMLAERIDDKLFLGLIDRWLKADILERDGQVIHPQTGTPQVRLQRTCGVPLSGYSSRSSSIAPAFSHFPISRSIAPSLTLRRINPSSF